MAVRLIIYFYFQFIFAFPPPHHFACSFFSSRFRYGQQDFDGSLPGRGTVVAIFKKDQLAQVKWDNGSLNFYHIKTNQRDLLVAGKGSSSSSTIPTTFGASGIKMYAFGSSTGGGYGSGLTNITSGLVNQSLLTSPKTTSSSSEYQEMWNLISMKRFGISKERLLDKMKKLQISKNGEKVVIGLFNIMEQQSRTGKKNHQPSRWNPLYEPNPFSPGDRTL